MPKRPNERAIDRELRRPSKGTFQGHPGIKTMVGLFRTADRAKHLVARLMREHDLTLSQFEVLRILRDSDRKMTVVELTGLMLHPTPAMTGVLDRLERDALVERERGVEDRRLVHVRLLRKGKSLVKRLDKPMDDLHAQFVAGLSAGERATLDSLLQKVRDAIPD